MRLIIPMAGRGTRLRPHTHVTPKPLLPVVGTTMVERIVRTFMEVLPRPLDEAIFVLGPDFPKAVYDQLEGLCTKLGIKSGFAVQKEALGTGHAVIAAADFMDGEIITVFADTLFYMDEMVDLEGADVVAWVKHVDDPSRFGVAVREGDRVVRLVEKPQELISTEALIGIYWCKEGAVMRDAIQYLIDNDVRGHGEYQLTDALDKMLQDGSVIKTANVAEWLDCGTIEALADTSKIIQEKEKSDEKAGTVENSVVIEPVFIAPGATVTNSVVGPNVTMEAGATISNSVVRDSILFEDSEVANTSLVDSMIGRNGKVTPSPLRLNVGDHSEVG